MMHSEFCEISGYTVSYKVYAERFEPAYIAMDIDKRDFIKFMLPTIREVARQERIAREKESRLYCYYGNYDAAYSAAKEHGIAKFTICSSPFGYFISIN